MKASYNQRSRRGRGVLAAAAAAALAGAFGYGAAKSSASDHIDSDTLSQDHASDINDVYAFLDPNDNSRVVLVMTTNPFLISSEIIGQGIFDQNVRYRFEIENTGDAAPDLYVDVRFSPGIGRETAPQTAFVGLTVNGGSFGFTALSTLPTQGDVPPEFVVTTDPATGVSLFAGAVDDPFFLDNTAANRWVLSSIADPGNPDDSVFTDRIGDDGVGRDTYAGFNTLAIAVSVPADLLRGEGDVIGVNAVVQRRERAVVRGNGRFIGRGSRFVNIDRQGNPLVNNGLVPGPRKVEYNAATTADDAAGRFEDDIAQSLRNFGSTDETVDTLLDLLVRNGDIIRLNLAIANTGDGGGNNAGAGFPVTGRRLGDDVGDATFTAINNGAPITDGVDANEVPFTDTFPFFAPQITPNPRGVDNPDDRTRL